MSDQITMANAKGVSTIPLSILIEIIHDQTGQLVSPESLVDLVQSLPFDVDANNTEIILSGNQDSSTNDEETDIEKPAIEAARKELR